MSILDQSWVTNLFKEDLVRKRQDEVLARFYGTEEYKAVEKFINEAARPELLMVVKDWDGFMYMKGYIRAMKDVITRIESAHKKAQKEQNG